jgi:glycerol uptake facilitator protein
MGNKILGEFLGTMVLILLGNGVVANSLLRKSKGEGAGWMAITSGWAFGVLAGVLTAIAFGSPDANINPAVTFASAAITGDFSKLIYYVPAQVLGAMVGATLVWLHFYPHWRETPDADTKIACFCTAPAIRNIPWNVVSEVIGTFVLVLVASAIGSKGVTATGVGAGVGPYLVSCLVWGIGLSLGGTTGYAINPARDLGPRMAHALLPIAKKGPSDWGYAAVPVFGPLLGAGLAALLLRSIQF